MTAMCPALTRKNRVRLSAPPPGPRSSIWQSARLSSTRTGSRSFSPGPLIGEMWVRVPPGVRDVRPGCYDPPRCTRAEEPAPVWMMPTERGNSVIPKHSAATTNVPDGGCSSGVVSVSNCNGFETATLAATSCSSHRLRSSATRCPRSGRPEVRSFTPLRTTSPRVLAAPPSGGGSAPSNVRHDGGRSDGGSTAHGLLPPARQIAGAIVIPGLIDGGIPAA